MRHEIRHRLAIAGDRDAFARFGQADEMGELPSLMLVVVVLVMPKN